MIPYAYELLYNVRLVEKTVEVSTGLMLIPQEYFGESGIDYDFMRACMDSELDQYVELTSIEYPGDVVLTRWVTYGKEEAEQITQEYANN